MEAGLSVRAMARELDMATTTYQHYEDRYRRDFFPIEFLTKVRQVLEDYGLDDELLKTLVADQIANSDARSRIAQAPLIDWNQIGSFCEAGTEYDAGDNERQVLIDYHRSTVLALKVQGNDLSRVAPDKSTIIVDYSKTVPVCGKFYVIETPGKTLAKRYLPTPERFENYSTEPENDVILMEEVVQVVGQIVRVVTEL